MMPDHWLKCGIVAEQPIQGIIGANPGNEYNINGVAYDATLYSYRIFGCEGSVQDPGKFYPLPRQCFD